MNRAYLTCCLALAVSVGGLTAADIDATRNALEQSLAERLAAGDGTPVEIRLELEGGLLFHDVYVKLDPRGIRRERLDLHLFHRQGQWFGQEISAVKPRLQARLDIADLTTDELAWDGQRLQGQVSAMIGRRSKGQEMGRGENSHSMAKAARKPVTGWHIGGRERVQRQRQSLTIDCQLLSGGEEYELVLHDAIGDYRPANPPADDDTTSSSWEEIGARTEVRRRPMTIRLVRDATGWVEATAKTPSWNRSIHQVDPQGLRAEGDRLHGPLVVTLLPDPWVPSDRKRRVLTLHVDTSKRFGQVDSQVRITGDQGEFTARLSGSVWQPLRGTYESSGYDGDWSGRLKGRVRAAPAKPADLTTILPSESDPHARYTACEGLAQALCQYPAPVEVHLLRPFELFPLASSSNGAMRQSYAAGLARYAAQAASAPAQRRGNCVSSDPDFGPYGLGTGALPVVDGVHQLAAAASGVQQWQQLTAWQTIGPFVGWSRQPTTPTVLPEVLPIVDSVYGDERLVFGRKEITDLQWHATAAGTGNVHPPSQDWQAIWINGGKMSSYSKHPLNKGYRSRECGSRSFIWYAQATVEAAAAETRWISLRAVDFGQLWLNGRLVWASGADYDAFAPTLLAVELEQGRNEFLLRCGKHRVGYAPPSADQRSLLALSICTQGAPRSAEQLILATKREAKDYAASPSQALGYTSPGARIFTQADPPLAWDLEKGANIRWRQEHRARTVPVVDGDQLLLMREPHELLSVDRSSGEIRWQAEANVLLLHASAENRDQLADFKQFAAVLRQLADWGQEIASLGRTVRNKETAQADREAAEAEIAVLQGRMRELTDKWSAVIETLDARGALEHKRAHGNIRYPSLGGRAGAVPVVTDNRIVVHVGLGGVACFDKQGKQLWLSDTGRAWTGGVEYSPVVVEGLVLVAGPVPRAKGDKQHRYEVIAYDLEDGRERWRSSELAGHPSALAAVHLLRDGQEKYIVLTADGRLLDLVDGAVLAEGLWPFLLGGHETFRPFVRENEIWYQTARGQLRMRLWLEADGSIAKRIAFDKRRSGWSGNLAIQQDGLLYVPRLADEWHSHNPVPWDQLDVYDSVHGDHLAKPKPVLRNASNPSPLVSAGDYLLYTDSGRGGMGIKEPQGQVAILTRGERPKLMAWSEMGPVMVRGHPVCAGRDMYLLVGRELLCIAVDDDAGRLYEEEAMAKAVLADLQQAPKRGGVTDLSPLDDYPATLDSPVTELAHNVPPNRWLMCGPMPSVDGDPFAEQGGIAGLVPDMKTSLKQGEQEFLFTAIGKDVLRQGGMRKVNTEEGDFYFSAATIDLLAAIKRTPHSTAFFHAVVECRRPQTLRVNQRSKGARVWVAGQQVVDGQLLRFTPGYYPIMLRVDVGRIPPVGKPTITISFLQTQDPEQRYAIWLSRVKELQPRLQRIVDKLPESAYAIYAKAHLQHLE